VFLVQHARHHRLYLRSIIVGGFPPPFEICTCGLVVSLALTFAVASMIGLASTLLLRSIALSNCTAKSSLVTIAVTASFGCSCGNAIPAARILVGSGSEGLR
jgi:hypothetical protein